MFEGISGHKRQIELLTRALVKGKLAHAYVFAGPSGVGKKLVVRELARELLESGGKDISREAGPGFAWHPDLLIVERREDKTEILIDQIRELVYKLALKPYSAKYKVAIIDDAELLNDEAANALLKCLEEPKNYTYIFLITSNPQKLPKTILSRCQKVNFGKVEGIATEPEESQEFFQTFMQADLADKLIAAYEIADLETFEIKKLLESWSLKLETELVKNPTKTLANKISQIMKSEKFLDQNVNSKLLLTNLMINS